MDRYNMLDILYEYDGWLTSPIVDEDMAFPFLTMGHLDFCEAMGFRTYQATKYLRQVAPDALKDEEELDRIIDRHFFEYSYFERELDKLKDLIEGKGILKGGGVFGPLTIASDILGAERTLKLSVRDPGFVLKLVSYVTEFSVELCRLEAKNGADFFWVAEPFASVLAPKNFTEFSGRFLKKIFDSTDLPGWLHVCGPTLRYTRYLEETGAQVLSIDYVTDIGKCIRMVDENTIIMGNVSPSVLLLETDEIVEEEIKSILDACGNYKNFIMSTGCIYMEGTKPERIKRLYELTDRYKHHSNEEFRQLRELINMMSAHAPEDKIKRYIEERSVRSNIVGIAGEECEKIRESRLLGGYTDIAL